MNIDLSLPLKAGVIQHLSADLALLEDVPADRFFGINVPTNTIWPYVRYGVPIVGGFEASCWSGMETDITLHAFAEATSLMAGEDKVLQIAAKIVQSMEGLVIPGLAIIDNQWGQTTLLKDEPEADRWHAAVTFTITAVKKDA